jgi:hypothetical protein
MKRFEFDHKDRKHLIAEGLRCPVCDGEVYERGSVPERYAQIRYSLFHCPGSGHKLVLRVDSEDGHIKIHFYALPDDVTLGWFHEPIEEPEPEPIVSAPEPVVASKYKEKKFKSSGERALDEVMDFVVRRQTMAGLAFDGNGQVFARVVMIGPSYCWAVQSTNPGIDTIMRNFGGRSRINKDWRRMGILYADNMKQPTRQVTMTPKGRVVRCYVFTPDAFPVDSRIASSGSLVTPNEHEPDSKVAMPTHQAGKMF